MRARSAPMRGPQVSASQNLQCWGPARRRVALSSSSSALRSGAVDGQARRACSWLSGVPMSQPWSSPLSRGPRVSSVAVHVASRECW